MSNRLPQETSKPRILAVIESHPEAMRVLRATKRKAEATNASWEVVAVETATTRKLMQEEDHENMVQLLTLAEQMGAVVSHTLAGSSLEGVLALLEERKQEGVTIAAILVGTAKDRKSFWGLKPSLAVSLYRRLSNEYAVSLVPLGQEVIRPSVAGMLMRVNGREILMSLLAVALATAALELIDYIWPHKIVTFQHRNKPLIYMIACAFAAGRYGFIAGLVAAVSSFLVMSVLYVSPYNNLIIDDLDDAANLALFMLATIVIAFFGSSEHSLKQALLKRADRFNSLLRLHRMTLNKQSLYEAIQTLDAELSKLLGTDILFLLPSLANPNHLETLYKQDTDFSDADRKALSVCWAESKTTGVGAPYNPGCKWRFEPLITAKDEIGVLAVLITDKVVLNASFGRLLSGIADQAALILERLELGQIAEETRLQAEREKLRAMLLSSVSHDLKTPLASVIGSLSVYRGMKQKLSEEQQVTLINTALDEAQRLNSFISNILDMTRIESGQITMKTEWVNPEDLLTDVRRRLRERLRNHEVTVKGFVKKIKVSMDGMMTGQVLQNLMDNAAKYTPPGTHIEVSWRADERGFSYQVRDYGPGIPEDHLEKVFDKYTRIKKLDSQVAGTGLGLAIARAIMQAQGGSVAAANHPEGGAVFTLTLPYWRAEETREVA